MHRGLTPLSRRDDRGAVALLVAATMAGILVVVALVLDFGLVRIDRQVDKSAADSAALAGAHGLNTGDGSPHPYVGVCTALRYLKRNAARFAGFDTSTGWTNGAGGVTASGCSDLALRSKICKPADQSTWAVWSGSGSYQGVHVDVTIRSGYVIPSPTGPDAWSEDGLPASTGDPGDSSYGGCDQLAVEIGQSRRPGFGTLATTADLTTAVRSVARIQAVPGDSAPAMLLLKQTGCPVLKTGSSGGTSFIHVKGKISTDGRSQPGTIHSDSDGVGCTGSNNSWIFGGLGADGIVAYAAPLVSNPSQPDPAKPGSITAVAAANGITGARLRDSNDYVYGSSLLTGIGGTHSDVGTKSLVTRRLIDQRYFAGVKLAISGASGVFASGAAGPPDATWKTLPPGSECAPTPLQVTALSLTSADKLYVNCVGKFTGDNSGTTFNAGTVYFRGWLNPGSTLNMPNAHHVYVGNHGSNADAISLSTGGGLSAHTTGNLDLAASPPACTTGQSFSKAVFFVRSGDIKQNGGSVQLCRTTMFLLGGSATGCVPSTTGTAPTSAPCPGINGGAGTGGFSMSGSSTINWTAPDTLDTTTDLTSGAPTPSAVAAWQDPNGPEDLALWSESGAYSMNGSGKLAVRGVYMVPNAEPFSIGGGGSLNLENAQFVASSVLLNGSGTQITMSVDPNSAVTLPDQGVVGLVR